MDRLSYVQRYGGGSRGRFDKRIFKALVYCLPPEETCRLFVPELQAQSERREIVLGKIRDDMETEVRACHRDLIEALLARFLETTGNQKQWTRMSLHRLCEVAGEEQQRRILLVFLKSAGRLARRNAYEILNRAACEEYYSEIVEAWSKYGDGECAAIMAKHFPDAFLVENASVLHNALFADNRSLRALFLRLAHIDDKAFALLLTSDPVTYLYLCVKLKRPVNDKTAWNIYATYKKQRRQAYDDRTGLIIWCFGQMGLWDVILKVQRDLDRPI